MTRYALSVFASLLIALSASAQGAFGEEWLNVNVGISISGFTVSSSGSADYQCINCTEFGWIASGKHVINNGTAGTIVASATFGSDSTLSYSGNISGATAYSNCYDARVEATGRFGKHNYINSGQLCAAPEPESTPPPTEPADKCDGETGMHNACSPIIINLADGAWKLSGADDPVAFDIDADGELNRITWTGRGEPLAFLALDRNTNGVIDEGSELFGTATRLESGGRAPNGFEALKEFDANRDGLIDASDHVWASLLLWTDANHDGLSQSGEISRIAYSDVVAMRTVYGEIGRTDPHQNSFRYMSTLWLGQGQRPYYDVFFRSID